MNAQEVISLMNEVGAKLAEPAQHVLEIWLKQIMIFGVVDIVVGIVLLVIVSALLWKTLHMTAAEWAADGTGIWGGLSILSVIIGAVGIGLAIRGSMLLANPEYWFMQDILRTVFGP